MRIDQAEMLFRNRFRLQAGKNDRMIMLRAHARLECTNRGHAWDKGQCQRCGEIDPAILAALPGAQGQQAQAGQEIGLANDATQTPAP